MNIIIHKYEAIMGRMMIAHAKVGDLLLEWSFGVIQTTGEVH